MYDLNSLREALSPIRQLGEGEIEFDVSGNLVKLRLLTPQEELDIFTYARSVIDDVPEEERDIAVTTLYFDRFRVGTLAKAVVSIGDWVIPQNETVFTGKTLEGGVAEQMSFRMAFREELATWARPLLERLFAKYGELLEQINGVARAAIQLEQMDYDTEIEQLEGRLEELRQQREESKKEGKDVREEHLSVTQNLSGSIHGEVSAIASAGVSENAPGEAAPTATVQAPAPIGGHQPPPQTSQAPPRQRQSLIPNAGPPLGATRAPEPEQPQPEQGGIPHAMQGSSMVDAGDQDAMQAALQAEDQRQRAIRARKAQLEQEQAVPQSRAPHQQAALLSRDISQGGQPLDNVLVGGESVPAFALPPQELTGKSNRPVAQEVRVNEAPAGAVNPRFHSPKR